MGTGRDMKIYLHNLYDSLPRSGAPKVDRHGEIRKDILLFSTLKRNVGDYGPSPNHNVCGLLATITRTRSSLMEIFCAGLQCTAAESADRRSRETQLGGR